MSFWILATGVTLLAALLMCWPLLRKPGRMPGVGIMLLLLIPVSTLLLYQLVGSPEGLDVDGRFSEAPVSDNGPAEFAQLVAELESRLQENPDDLEGWVLLGRSYKTVQQYDKALFALQQARSLAPDDPYVAVELAEAMIFTSTERQPDPQIQAILEQAVQQVPELQKGLWLLGIVASQSGDDAGALVYWERLLPLLDPASGVASSVKAQVDQARNRLGLEAPADWGGIEVTVNAPEGLDSIPDGAVLFIIARDPNAPRPPLGARRIEPPQFPVTIKLGDGDSMMPQRPISGVAEIELLARLSLSGNPVAQAGDLESPASRVSSSDGAALELTLSRP